MWLSYAEPLSGTFSSFKYLHWITGKSKISDISYHLNKTTVKKKLEGRR